ncbi:restriction endonuclease subunit S [Helicobacter pylori]|uniref:restriction endonuclease subunit S n=1 Tax=Helicobacter pylori TaxID=210 RepID=UPI00046DB7CF|nr:restriction endonuclease subunit S [Helicobacter pylori]
MDALMLPLNWQRVRLGDIFFITAGGDLSKPHYSNTKQSDFNYPIYSNAIEKKGLYGYSSFFIIKNKSITITSRGTIGVAFFRDYPYVPIGRLLVLQPKISNIDCRFYAEYINSKVKFNTEQTTIPQLTIPKVALCEIPLPPLNEQIAIANILSALDHYLYTLDALILKKESVKKALRIKMLNQILASNGVEFKKIGEICLIKRGRVIAKKILQENGKYPVYSSQTLNNGILGFIDTYDFDGEFLTWTTDGAYAGSVFYRNGRFSITNVCGLLQVIQDNILHKYLYYILQITAPLHVNPGMGNPKLMSAAMQQIEIPLPPLNEQIAIANILSALDNEITSLKNKKSQFENIKKALNHDLMSAKIRVLKK